MQLKTKAKYNAGNIGKERSPSAGASDLATPTLKQDFYTTGRGGSGNMAKNDKGAEARAAQDVAAPAVLSREPEGVLHYGRGGAANVTKAEAAAKKAASERKSNESARDKGLDLLGKIGLGSKK